MAIPVGSNSSRTVAFLAVFTAMIAILDVIPTIPGFYAGIWDSWPFLLAPIVGILLGPYLGALSVGLGSLIGHMIFIRADPTELLFMWGLALGAAVAGFVYQKKWLPVLGIYTAMLTGYFIYPVTWELPLWGIWDILIGYGIVLIFSFMTVRGLLSNITERKRVLLLLFSTVIALETDILFRVLVLVPGQVYWFIYGWTPSYLAFIWSAAGFITPIKVAVAAFVSVTLGLQLLRSLERHGDSVGLHNENTLPN
ncbi:MAG: hypothetical protein ACFFF9_13970 [Candidatus Thorarchaeota archaeon]